MKHKVYFKTCAICGCHLDPGEQCDCMKEGVTNDRSGEGSAARVLS